MYLLAVVEDDYGAYNCEAENSAGKNTFRLTLEKPGMLALNNKNSWVFRPFVAPVVSGEAAVQLCPFSGGISEHCQKG